MPGYFLFGNVRPRASLAPAPVGVSAVAFPQSLGGHVLGQQSVRASEVPLLEPSSLCAGTRGTLLSTWSAANWPAGTEPGSSGSTCCGPPSAACPHLLAPTLGRQRAASTRRTAAGTPKPIRCRRAAWAAAAPSPPGTRELGPSHAPGSPVLDPQTAADRDSCLLPAASDRAWARGSPARRPVRTHSGVWSVLQGAAPGEQKAGEENSAPQGSRRPSRHPAGSSLPAEEPWLWSSARPSTWQRGLQGVCAGDADTPAW